MEAGHGAGGGRLMKARATTLAALMALMLALGACGNDDSAGSSGDLPEDVVAVVGTDEITEPELAERVASVQRSQPRPSAAQRRDPQLRAQAKRQAEIQALTTLLTARALKQEADARGAISVTTADARGRWEGIAAVQFRNRRALRRFLGRQTERDVIEQLRVQMLSDALYAQIAAQGGDGKKGQQAVERFQREFRKRWQAKTICREGLEAAGCSAPEGAE